MLSLPLSYSKFATSRRALAAALLALPFAALTGCGLGTAATSASSSSVQGMVHGGPNPVVGALVTLYATGTGSYGATASVLGTTTTQSDGSFTFTGATSCATPTQEYIVVSGGNPGAGTNPNYLLMAALGDCSTVSATSVIWVDEVTTIAAAYSLSNFISISGSTVNIGAPTTNAAATGTCTGTGVSMSCNAAGLSHAFANALNLASSIGTSATPPTGAAYTTTPSSTSGTVPTTLINALANSIEVCVNSTGGSAGDSSTCGSLFAATTPPNLGTTPVAPTNTLQAAINMAKYPTNNVSTITGLPTGFNTYYNPSLSVTPHDLSLAIFYKGAVIGGTTSTFGYPYFLSLGINDTVYTLTQPSSSGTPVTAVAMSSNGTGTWVSGSVNTTACAAGVPCVSAPDTNGTLWTITGSTSAGKLTPVATSGGTVGTAIAPGAALFGLAIDRSDNVFASVPTANAANNFLELTSGASAMSAVQGGGAAISTASVPAWVWLDSSANLWSADKYTASTASVVTYLPASGSTFGTPVTQTVDATTGDGGLYGLVTDSLGNAYSNNGLYLQTIPAGNTTPTSARISTTTGSATVNASSARYSTIDGNGSIFMPDNNGTSASFVWQYLPPVGSYAGGFVNLLPCESASGTTTCSTTAATEAMDGPRNAAVDSTGSIWIASSTNGNVVQIIGTAAPTWPQLSYLKPGVKP